MKKTSTAPVSVRVAIALQEHQAPQHRRIMLRLREHPGTLTHEISQTCHINNVPGRISELNRLVLPKHGLQLQGRSKPGHLNALDQPCHEFAWQFVKQEQ